MRGRIVRFGVICTVAGALGVLFSCSSDGGGGSPATNGGGNDASAANDSSTTPGSDGAATTDASTSNDAGQDGSTSGDGSTGPFALTSSAYTEGSTIPKMYECTSGGGQNVSPPLSWTPGPAGTQSYALVMRDLNFQNGFIHWTIWDIPAATLSLPQNVDHQYQPSAPAGAKQAPFDNTITGYYGPCSPSTVNTYEITLYAIPTATIAGLSQTSTKQQAAAAIVGAATATTKLAGKS